MHYVPAQRVLALAQQGWWRNWGDYRTFDPYVLKAFSECMRMLMERGFGLESEGGVFPQKNRLNNMLRQAIDEAIFHGFSLKLDDATGQKRLVLSGRGSSLPYMVWSAGQREFVPLLLDFYWLVPPSKMQMKKAIRWVAIEEIEMGLHPYAITSVVLVVLNLLRRGYRVVLSTHSPHILDVVWGIRTAQKFNAKPDHVLNIFKLQHSQVMQDFAKDVLSKKFRVHYFNHEPIFEGYNTLDISELDPFDDSSVISGWGGLSEFSGHVADVVTELVADSSLRGER
jgi:hypothetical protein